MSDPDSECPADSLVTTDSPRWAKPQIRPTRREPERNYAPHQKRNCHIYTYTWSFVCVYLSKQSSTLQETMKRYCTSPRLYAHRSRMHSIPLESELNRPLRWPSEPDGKSGTDLQLCNRPPGTGFIGFYFEFNRNFIWC